MSDLETEFQEACEAAALDLLCIHREARTEAKLAQLEARDEGKS